MNNYDLSEVDSEKPQENNQSPYMTYGGPQVLKINDIELKFSQSTNAPKAILHMETKPLNDPSFTPIQGASGKVGKVACGVYMNSDILKKEFLQKMKTIAAAVGVEDEINKIKSENFEEVVQRITNVIKNKFARYTIVASEYPKSDAKVGITLSLPKFKFVESLDTDPSTLVVFDKENKYHYKKMVPGTTPYYANSPGSYGSYVQPVKPAHVPDNPNDPAIQDLPF